MRLLVALLPVLIFACHNVADPEVPTSNPPVEREVATVDPTCGQRRADACHSELCTLECCSYGGDEGGCAACCVLKDCQAIAAELCPLERCQLMDGCSGTKICFAKFDGDAPACGQATYYGQDVACCPGLSKRCGAVRTDGSCDPAAGGYNGLPYCLPCGDGICDATETKCSCPEDC